MSSFSIDGIISGIDTSSYIDAIIEFERQPAVLMENEQAEKTNIITTIKSLQALTLALETSVKSLTQKSTFETAFVNISDEAYLSATADGEVSAGTYDIQILAKARNHQLASQGISDESATAFGTGTITIGVGDRSPITIDITSENNSLVDIKNAINDADAGVSASIVNDGSDSNPYRLILTAENTGAANQITVSSNLTGGINLNYDTALFDAPEEVSVSSNSDAAISLGATAAFTGNANKTYTFTVQGTGSQTVGTDNITINWTDGTNSGSILVTQADTEVELVGDGADGLKLTFSAGELNAGDIFEVSTFAPLLQEAFDAKIALGTSGGTGSPITITSDTNEFENVIGGVTLEVLDTTEEGDSISVTTGTDTAAIEESINSFITYYNKVISFITEQNSYDVESGESGVLFGDYTIQSLQNSLRNTLSSLVDGLESNYNQLYTIGIGFDSDGLLTIKDSSKLEKALNDNLSEVIDLFTDSGSSDVGGIEFVSATNDTKVGEYDVNITQAATRGYFQGAAITDPSQQAIVLTSANNRLKFTIDGLVSDEIILNQGTYDSAEDLISEIQTRIDNDDKIGNLGLTVEWVSTGNTGYINLTSASYGTSSKVELKTSIGDSAFSILGLMTGVSYKGQDVEGTINGEEAIGKGQYLTGKEGNEYTEGLKLKITLEESQLGDGAEGTISVVKGAMSKLYAQLETINQSEGGILNSRIGYYEDSVADLTEQIEAFDERLELQRERLEDEFAQMEETLSELSTLSDYLISQFTNVWSNWGTGSSK
ncbi:MAG: flagellar filament capping protein FliD [Candidatus Zixiibacteriota bacterium]